MQTHRLPPPFSTWIRSVATGLCVVFSLHGLVPAALASPIPSALITPGDAREADIATIQLALETKVAQHRLHELGFTPAEIENRIALASDEDLHQLAVQSETVMAGGDGGIIITVLLVVLLVLLIQRLTSNSSAPPAWVVHQA